MAVASMITHLFFTVSIVGAVPDSALLAQAETAFRLGMEVRDNPNEARPKFREAASCYEELRRRGAHNTDLYRNQGNCYLLAGDLPQAILAYRRGLRLTPADSILRAALAHAREQVAYPGPGKLGQPPPDNWPLWLPYFSLRLRLLAFVGFYSLGWLGMVHGWIVRRTATWGIGILGFLLAGAVTTSVALEVWGERGESLHPLVVIAVDGVTLRKGNGALYPPRVEWPLNRGLEVRCRFERGDWLQIELAGGPVGWIPRSSALLDSP